MKEGVGAVGIDVDLGPRTHEMGPHRAFRDLQFQGAVGDAIVLTDLALLLHAQNLAEVDAPDRRERRALAGRRNGETRVVGGKGDLAEEGVGRLDRVDPGELELLRQTVLERSEIRSERPRAKGVRKNARLSRGYAANRPRYVPRRAA